MGRKKKVQPKKILTLNDLYSFYEKKNQTCVFNSSESGYQLSVQVPAQFEVNNEYEDDSLLFCKIKAFHVGINRNNSSVTQEAAEKAMKTMAYKPVLANFCEYEDEDGNMIKDFTSHDMEIKSDGSVEYIEHQIGCFTADEPWMELEEETGHNFVYAYCAIPREYTDAVSIIERKGGTKVSVELSVNEMSYSATDKVLELTDVVVMGITCLGTNPKTGEEVQEGMKNARLDIADFSTMNNSIINYSEQFVEMQEKLNALLSHFDINKNLRKEANLVVDQEIFEEVADNEVTDMEETTEEVTVFENDETVDETSEDVVEEPTVEIQESQEETNESDIVLENEEDFKEKKEDDDSVSEEEVCKKKKCSEEDEEDDDDSVSENEVCKKRKCSIEINDETKTFEISLDEKIYALENLVNAQYGESDNDYYMVKAYEDNVVMIGWWTGRSFKQSYTEDNGTFTLSGDRVEVFAQYLTKEEIDAVENMRANYSSIQEELNSYKYSEVFADKMSVFEDEAYGDYLETEEFKTLMSKESVDSYSKAELQEKADATLGKLVKLNKTFSFNETKTVNKVSLPINAEPKKESPYGNLFDK